MNMFGIGLGEILLVLLVVFFISPKELPRFMRKVGELLGVVEKVRKEVFAIKENVKEIIDEAGSGNEADAELDDNRPKALRRRERGVSPQDQVVP